jgi:hypothetical protein
MDIFTARKCPLTESRVGATQEDSKGDLLSLGQSPAGGLAEIIAGGVISLQCDEPGTTIGEDRIQ